MALDLGSLSAKLLARCEEPTKASIIYGATGNLRASKFFSATAKSRIRCVISGST
jgi:hypothetical protein